MTSTTIRTTADVRLSAPEDHTAVVSALALAFEADPVFQWLFDDPARQASATSDFFDLVVADLARFGRSWTTEPAVTGAALWVPAGEPSMSEAAGEALGALLHELGEGAAGRTAALIEAMEHAHPTVPHEYLWFVGVVPDVQGQGVGSALLAAGLAHADAQGVPSYLEATTPESKALYERHGFVSRPPLRVLDCPPLWPMRRPVGGR
jgi:GNAT superfamily N-acetyltransferase